MSRSEERKQVLIADDEVNLRRVLGAQLERDGYEVHTAAHGEEALAILGEHHIDVVVSDLRMPRLDGMELLKETVAQFPGMPFILITAHGTVDTAVEALKLGAFDFVTKPFDREELRNVIRKAARTVELSTDVSASVAKRPSSLPPAGKDGELPGRYRIIGDSDKMASVYDVIERVADTPSTVLITGESGTGKELIAQALHDQSSRRKAPLIRVNCAAIPPDLLESELFGYEKGAFTGAATSKPGRFELADGGTLFLDEIAEIPVNMQVKLLRALQEQEFERVGGIKTLAVDVRLIAATNRDLKEEIQAGRFREDLYYRLNVVHVHLPPLRERTQDIPLLTTHFVSRFNERLNRSVAGLSDAAESAMLAYRWPGNIRELENVIERCMLFCDGEEIEPKDLPPDLLGETGAEIPEPRARTVLSDTAPSDGFVSERPDSALSEEEENGGLKEAVREATSKVERDLIARALEQTGGNVTHTARLLKISRKSLQTKMKELGLRS